MAAIRAQFVICSKSTWVPAIRREHAFAAEAARDGLNVVFLERPLDLRALRTASRRREWLAALRQHASAEPLKRVTVRPRATLVPPHRSELALAADAFLLERDLRSIPGIERTTVVAMLPWHWPAVAKSPARRKILDYTDDWEALVPGSEATVRRLLDRAEREADVITTVSADLQGLFQQGGTFVIRNGVGEALLGPSPTPLPGTRRLAYVGTLSDRFDAPLMAATLDRLPEEWHLDLYGPCQYPHREDRPDEELSDLLRSPRVSWHGTIERDAVAAALDAHDVLVVPHRRRKQDSSSPAPSWRGDVMKLYDYAARARPVVSTEYVDGLATSGPPLLALADDPEAFARAITKLAFSEPAALQRQRRWAEQQSWRQRWSQWSEVTGVATDLRASGVTPSTTPGPA